MTVQGLSAPTVACLVYAGLGVLLLVCAVVVGVCGFRHERPTAVGLGAVGLGMVIGGLLGASSP